LAAGAISDTITGIIELVNEAYELFNDVAESGIENCTAVLFVLLVQNFKFTVFPPQLLVRQLIIIAL
jgi:hypothetical protein